jgi:hypothetical protein
MAQRVQVLLVDDVDGGAADETVTFSLDGVSYEIDLTSAHAADLRGAMAHWVGHARKVGARNAGRPAGRGRKAGGAANGDATLIREWARANGHKVSERGRISAGVREAYAAAH